MQQLSNSSSYLSDFVILSWCGWLSYMHTSKLQHNYISHSKNTIGPSSVIPWGTKNIMEPTSWFPKSLSQTPWPWSFQQHILPGFLNHPLYRTLPGVTGVFPKIQQYHHGPKPNTSKWYYKLKCMQQQQQPKYTMPKHLSAIDFLLNQLSLPAILPSHIH